MRISSKGEREKAQGSRRREYYQKRGRCAWRSERERERGEGRQMEGERLNIGKREREREVLKERVNLVISDPLHPGSAS